MTTINVSAYTFAIIASGLNHDADDFEERFFKAGCDDATISIQKGAIVLEFTRDGKNFAHALFSAMADVRKAGAKIEHVEPDYLVSLSDIAARSNMSRAAISLYAKGERGEDFPAPVSRITTESPLWDWVIVARWMYKRRTISLSTLLEAKIVRGANLALLSPEGFEKAFANRFREELRV